MSVATREARAIQSVRDHLRRDGAAPNLTDIQVFERVGANEIVVCARLVAQATGSGDVVARVLTGAGAWYDPERRQALPSSHAMVVLEDGPGLWRGGGMGVARQRYCGSPRPGGAPSAVGAAIAPAVDAAMVQDREPTVAPMPAEPPVSALDSPTEDRPDGGSMTVVNPVRVRAGPGGDADILFIAERGRSFTVHGVAPGGWVQVGDAFSVAGWAHSSLLTSDP